MTLVELLKSYNKLKKEPNILILGLDNAGKTTLLNYLTHEDNKNTKPTPGVNGKSIQCCGINLNVYDLGGQKAIREYWKYYYENVDALTPVPFSAEQAYKDQSLPVISFIFNFSIISSGPKQFSKSALFP